MSSLVHGEIVYFDRTRGINTHNDICPPDCKAESMTDEEWRRHVHSCLDEWITKSNGTGAFYLKGHSYNF